MTEPKIPQCKIPNIPELKEFEKCVAHPRKWLRAYAKQHKISTNDFVMENEIDEH